MTLSDLQTAIGAKPDGIWGEASRLALLRAFTNPAPGRASPAQVQAFARQLGVTPRQLAAVASVESAGGGYDKSGRPKMLFERHKFHHSTAGRYSPSPFSNPQPGGYDEDSWAKLLGAIATGAVDAAFMAASWGKFQVLDEYWQTFGYVSPFALAISTVASEVAHYQLLVDYIEFARLQGTLAKLSANPDACRAFAKAYNGAGYETFAYHTKLAAAMA